MEGRTGGQHETSEILVPTKEEELRATKVASKGKEGSTHLVSLDSSVDLLLDLLLVSGLLGPDGRSLLELGSL